MIHLVRLTANDFKQLRALDLAVPHRGRVLVEGLNEAGKSTLFEAVYVALYGRPLAGASLDDCIRYGAEEAWLELEVSLAGGRRMIVSRRLRRGRPNRWSLEIHDGRGGVEEISSNREVNARVEQELGLDGEALLNTCFVEQKKLAKLEGMSRTQRRASLMKLLNLDRLEALGAELKPSAADEARLARLALRAELAEVQAGLPGLEEALGAAAADLAVVEADEALAEAQAELGALAALRGEAETAAAEAARLAERAADAEALREARSALREARGARDRARRAEAARAGAEAEAEAARAAAARRDELAARGRALGVLRGRLGWREAAAAQAEDLARRRAEDERELGRLAELRTRLNESRRELVEARAALREAEQEREDLGQDLRAFDVRDALAGWLDARAALDAQEDPAPRAEARRADRADVQRRARWQIGGLLAAGLALAAAAWLARGGWALWPLALAALACLGLAAARGYGAWRRLSALGEEIGRLEGEASVAGERRALLETRVAEAEAEMRRQRALMPGDPERARTAHAELDERLAGRERRAVAEALQRATETRARSQAAIEQGERREAELLEAAGEGEAARLAAAREAGDRRAARLEAFLARLDGRLAARAGALDLRPERGAVEAAYEEAREAYRIAQAEAGRRASLEQAAAERGAEAEAQWAEAEAAWRRAEGGPAADAPAALLPPFERAHADEAWERTAAALDRAYAAAGGDEVRAAQRAAADEASRLAGRRQAAERAWAQRRAALARLLEAQGLPPLAAPPSGAEGSASAGDTASAVAALAEARAALAPRLPARRDPDALRARRDEASRRLDLARHERRRLAGELGLADEVLEPEAERRALEEGREALAVRRRAADLVDEAGRSVMRQVMPSTIEHMRRLLPLLTGGRYFDARLTDDYTIEVYDDRAGTWLRKNIFSGGTQDQFSLALRLAFALATLPEERGAAPAFLFLDEPLGAFDAERAAALLDLLAEGELAESFDQIFLISHVRVDASRFDHRIRLADGRVVETTLEAPEEAEEGDEVAEAVEEGDGLHEVG